MNVGRSRLRLWLTVKHSVTSMEEYINERLMTSVDSNHKTLELASSNFPFIRLRERHTLWDLWKIVNQNKTHHLPDSQPIFDIIQQKSTALRVWVIRLPYFTIIMKVLPFILFTFMVVMARSNHRMQREETLTTTSATAQPIRFEDHARNFSHYDFDALRMRPKCTLSLFRWSVL